MRIQLLDPKWAAEKQRFMDKQKDSNLVEGEVIARSVDEFARSRGGVLGQHLFGSSKEELLGREEEGKRALEKANRIIKDHEHAQAQMAMPRPIGGGGGGGNHRTLMMGVPSQYHTQTMLNQQQTTVQTILTAPTITTTTTTDTTMIHHAKPDLSLPDAKNRLCHIPPIPNRNLLHPSTTLQQLWMELQWTEYIRVGGCYADHQGGEGLVGVRARGYASE